MDSQGGLITLVVVLVVVVVMLVEVVVRARWAKEDATVPSTRATTRIKLIFFITKR